MMFRIVFEESSLFRQKNGEFLGKRGIWLKKFKNTFDTPPRDPYDMRRFKNTVFI
jgi:hypothetical protein